MTIRDFQEREKNLIEQCEILANLVAVARPIYEEATMSQRRLLETTIGASIWYLPKPKNAWTGQISMGVLRSFHPNSGVVKPRLSEEHIYPRKIAAKLLFQDTTLDGQRLFELFSEKYGRIHLITPEENKTVRPFQQLDAFITPEVVYKKAGLVLIQVSISDLLQIKKRQCETIEYHLNNFV